MMLCRLSLVLCSMLAISSMVHADILYRIEFKPGSAPVESIDLRLFDEAAPITVTNFLNYVNGTTVNGGSYDDLFIQRHAEDFVIQAGQFTFNPAVGDGSFTYDSVNDLYPGGLQEVTRDDSIRSEAGISNVRGTIAMALLGGDTESGTNQWFINLIDNDGSGAVDLDSQNFTVFGEVQGTGMTTLDTVLDKTPPSNQSLVRSNLNELPLFNFTLGDTIDESKLLTVPSFTELMTLTGELDFGAVLTGMSSQLTATLTNTGASAVTLGAIGAVDALSAPFNLDAEDCASVTLNPTDSCTLDISYNPTVVGDPLVDLETDSIGIELASYGYDYTLSVRGVGVSALNPSLVPTPAAVAFGDIPLTLPSDQPSELLLSLDNLGSANITVSSVSLSGTDAAEFSITEDCVSSSPFSPTNSCTVIVQADPLSLGSKTANLVVVSNDPGSPFNIPITANVVARVAELTPELSPVDFGIIGLPGPSDPTLAELFTIENTGNVQVSVSDITLGGADAADFQFQQECIPASPLDPAETCRIQVVFLPTTIGDKTAELVLTSDATATTLTIPLIGTVVTPVAELTPELTTIDFGDVSLREPGDTGLSIPFAVNNTGNVAVTVSDVSLTGTDAAQFDILEACVAASPIELGDLCSVQVVINPTTTGTKSAELVITSNAVASPLTIPIVANVIVDADGLADSIEDANSNNGDGNNDDVLDSLQGDVASLVLENGVELTILSDPNDLNSVQIIPQASQAAPPAGVTFGGTGISFVVRNGASTISSVALLTPPGYRVEALYMYGPTPDDANLDWRLIDFDTDPNSDTTEFGRVDITSPSGATLQRQLTRATLTDGERGDNDLTQDGEILFEGALVITRVAEDSSAMDPVTMVLLGIGLLWCRRGCPRLRGMQTL